MVADTATFRHPYTGEVVSFRSPWTDITTEGPLGKIDVPSDVIKWNQTLQQWVQAGEGSTAISKVTFTPLYSNWHHGIQMDVSDMMYADYFTYEWGTNTGPGDRTVDAEFPRARGMLPLIELNPTLTFGITMRRRSLVQEHSLPLSHGRFLLHLKELSRMADLLILEAKH
jgi:hypothetical protein